MLKRGLPCVRRHPLRARYVCSICCSGYAVCVFGRVLDPAVGNRGVRARGFLGPMRGLMAGGASSAHWQGARLTTLNVGGGGGGWSIQHLACARCVEHFSF